MTKVMCEVLDEVCCDEEFRRLSRGSAMTRAIKMLRIKKALNNIRLDLGTDWQDIIEFVMLQTKQNEKKRNALLLSNHIRQKK